MTRHGTEPSHGSTQTQTQTETHTHGADTATAWHRHERTHACTHARARAHTHTHMAQSPYKFCAPASVSPKTEMGERGAWGGRETGREEETDQEDPKLRKCAKQIFKKRLSENTRLSKHTKTKKTMKPPSVTAAPEGAEKKRKNKKKADQEDPSCESSAKRHCEC